MQQAWPPCSQQAAFRCSCRKFGRTNALAPYAPCVAGCLIGGLSWRNKQGALFLQVMQLVAVDGQLRRDCPLSFDIEKVWHEEAHPAHLREQLQGSFGEVTALMGCVACCKCRLWGKLQILGAPAPQTYLVGCALSRHGCLMSNTGHADYSHSLLRDVCYGADQGPQC